MKQPPEPSKQGPGKYGLKCTLSLSFPMATSILLPAHVLLTLGYPEFFRAPVVAQAVLSTQTALSPPPPFGQTPSQTQLSHHIVLVFPVPRASMIPLVSISGS